MILKKGLGLAIICAAALATAAPALAGGDDKPIESSRAHADSSSPSVFVRHKHRHGAITGRRQHKPIGAHSGRRVHKPLATGHLTGKRQH